MGGVVGGQKFSLRRLQAMGDAVLLHPPMVNMVTHPAADYLGWRFESQLVDAGRDAAAVLAARGPNHRPKSFQPPALPLGHCQF